MFRVLHSLQTLPRSDHCKSFQSLPVDSMFGYNRDLNCYLLMACFIVKSFQSLSFDGMFGFCSFQSLQFDGTFQCYTVSIRYLLIACFSVTQLLIFNI